MIEATYLDVWIRLQLQCFHRISMDRKYILSSFTAAYDNLAMERGIEGGPSNSMATDFAKLMNNIIFLPNKLLVEVF